MTHDQLAALLPLAIVAPIVGAVLSPLLARVHRRAPLFVSLLALAASFVVLLLAAPTVYAGTVLTHVLGGWGPRQGVVLGVTVAADPFGLTGALLVVFLGALLTIASLAELSGLGAKELGAYASLLQLLLASLVGGFLTEDIVNLFVWFEVAALASYGLTGFFLERPLAVEAAFKIAALTNLAGFMLFVGAAILYASHGALNFGQLHQGIAQHVGRADILAIAMLVAGFATKAGLAPFHGWLPDAHTAAPGPVSALFSGLMVTLGIVGIVRVTLCIVDGALPALPPLLAVLGVISAIGGAVLALGQDELKRMLAYDTASQMGVLLIAVSVGTSDTVAGMTFHLVDHALFKTLLFLCAGAIVHASGMTKLSQMGGLARERKLLTAAFVVGALAIAGLPPLNGYVSVAIIHDGVRKEDPVLYAALVVAQVITVAAFTRATYLAFFRRRDDDWEELQGAQLGHVIPFAVLAAGCLVLGAFPYWMLDHVVAPAASVLTDGRAYADAVLRGNPTVPVEPVSFHYFAAAELGPALGSLVLGLLLGWWYVRRPHHPWPVARLRQLHTGSVNDYVAYSGLGLLVTIAVLMAFA